MTTVVAPAVAANQRAYRLTSIDAVRGLIVVIMALDHVRDGFMAGAQQDPMTGSNLTVALFFTRWITHFCAPVFVLLAGVSAGLMVTRRTPQALARLLLTRGLWLLFVECVLLSTAVTFAPRGLPELGGSTLVVLQVLWAIGVSMIVLSAAQFLGRRPCLFLGLIIVAGHNQLDRWWPMSTQLEPQWPWWVSLHAQMAMQAGPFLILFVYPVSAWIGVMLLGFGVSPVFELALERRNRALMRGGLAMTGAFVVIRALDLYGDPNGWQIQSAGLTQTILDFLNTTKYPPSLDFMLMTLGPAAMFCSVADRLPGRVRHVLTTYGRVPFAFYVPHFYLIHVLAIGLGVIQGFSVSQMSTLFFFYPQGYGLPLAGVYAVWILVVVLLYPFCGWVSEVKSRRRDWWLSYV